MYFRVLLCIYGDLFLLFIYRTFKIFAYIAEQGKKRHYYLTVFNQFKSLMLPLIKKERNEKLVKSKTLREFKKKK